VQPRCCFGRCRRPDASGAGPPQRRYNQPSGPKRKRWQIVIVLLAMSNPFESHHTRFRIRIKFRASVRTNNTLRRDINHTPLTSDSPLDALWDSRAHLGWPFCLGAVHILPAPSFAHVVLVSKGPQPTSTLFSFESRVRRTNTLSAVLCDFHRQSSSVNTDHSSRRSSRKPDSVWHTCSVFGYSHIPAPMVPAIVDSDFARPIRRRTRDADEQLGA